MQNVNKNYKKINISNNPDIKVTFFNMKSMSLLYDLYDDISKCKESEDLYLSEILNNNILLCLGNKMLVTATKDTHNNFQLWFPWYKWLYRILITTGLGAYKFAYNKNINENIPTPENINMGFFAHIYNKKKEKGQIYWSKYDFYKDKKNFSYDNISEFVYDSEVVLFMPDPPDETLAEKDNLYDYYKKNDIKGINLVTPWKSKMRSIIKKLKNFYNFESEQLSMISRKSNPFIHIMPEINFSNEQYDNWVEYYNSIKENKILTQKQFFGELNEEVIKEKVDKDVLMKIKEGVSMEDTDIIEKLTKKKGSLKTTSAYMNYLNDSKGIYQEPKQIKDTKYIMHGPNSKILVQNPPDESSIWEYMMESINKEISDVLGLESNTRTSMKTVQEIQKSNQIYNQKLRNIVKLFKDETKTAFIKANGLSFKEFYENIKDKLELGVNKYIEYYNKIPEQYEEYLREGEIDKKKKYVLNEKGIDLIKINTDFNVIFQPNSINDTDKVILAYQNGLLSYDEARVIIQKNMNIGMGDLYYSEENDKKINKENVVDKVLKNKTIENNKEEDDNNEEIENKTEKIKSKPKKRKKEIEDDEEIEKDVSEEILADQKPKKKKKEENKNN